MTVDKCILVYLVDELFWRITISCRTPRNDYDLFVTQYLSWYSIHLKETVKDRLLPIQVTQFDSCQSLINSISLSAGILCRSLVCSVK